MAENSTNAKDGTVAIAANDHIGLIVRRSCTERGLYIRQDDGDAIMVSYAQAKELADAMLKFWKERPR